MTVKRKIFKLISTIPAWEAFQCLRERWYWGEPSAIKTRLLFDVIFATAWCVLDNKRWFEIETMLSKEYPRCWEIYVKHFKLNGT